MARISNKNIESNKLLEKEIREDLLKEFKSVNSNASLDNLLNRLMTADEKNLLFRRMTVIKLINQGKKYREIKEILSISNGTISNVIDILSGRGYGRNPNRKRVYSIIKDCRKKRRKPLLGKYKGAESIL